MPRDLQAEIDALRDELDDVKGAQGKMTRRLERLYSDGAAAGLSREEVAGLINDRMGELAAELAADDEGGESSADDAESRKKKAAAQHIRKRKAQEKAAADDGDNDGERDDADGEDDDGDSPAEKASKPTGGADSHEDESTASGDESPEDEGGFFSRGVSHGWFS